MSSSNRASFELEVAKAILAQMASSINVDAIDLAQSKAQDLADSFQERGYFLDGPDGKLARYLSPELSSVNNRQVVSDQGVGMTRVQYVRKDAQYNNR